MASSIWHLLPLETWRARTDRPIAPDSLSDAGFVHCSPDAPTTLAVANTLYGDRSEQFVALVLDPDRLAAPVRNEPPAPRPPEGVPDGTLFPHVYGPLERSAVTDVTYARRDGAGRFVSLDRRPDTAEALDLLPHAEGGWFRQTWATAATCRPPGYTGSRATATAIYYLLNPPERSRWHRVRSDEMWLWHHGGPLRMMLGGDGDAPAAPDELTLGPDVADGQRPQLLVPGGTWQSARPVTGETLVSCIVSPGFDVADFEL